MSTPAIRAALERLIELDKGIQGISGIPVDDWTDATAAARAALAQPEGGRARLTRRVPCGSPPTGAVGPT